MLTGSENSRLSRRLPTEVAKKRPGAHSKTVQLRAILPSVYSIEVRRQQAQQEGEGFGSRYSPSHGPQHLLPATTVTSPWAVLEPADELKEIDEPYSLERPLAPSLRPPLRPPELRPPSPRLFLLKPPP